MKRSINMLWFLLLANVAVKAIAGIKVPSIHACSGESVRLFQNISIKVPGTDTFLYKESTIIAIWSESNAEQGDERCVHYNNGNIWMHNIDVSDDATYTVMQTMDDKHSKFLYEVRLIVLVAPEKSCRLQLKRDGDTLIASLETGAACGNSEVTVYFLDYPFIAVESQAKAKLSPGKEAGTYYACIVTPALRCAGRFKPFDFCSSLTIDESNDYTATATIIAVISVVCLALLFLTFTNCLLVIRLIKKQRSPCARNHGQEGTVEISSCYKPSTQYRLNTQ